MARFDKSSTKGAQQDAALAANQRAKKTTAPSIEDTMFFPRLRRHAKWMFVFLAVALGGGFVLFGVGAGGTGVGDILRGGGGSNGPSVSSAQKKTEESPNDVEAWRALSTALQADSKTNEAIEAQKTMVALAPKDTNALRGWQASVSPRRVPSNAKRRSCRPARPPGGRPGLPGSLHVALGSAASRGFDQHSRQDPELAENPGALDHRAERVHRERQRVQEDRGDQPKGSQRPARARSGRPAGR